MQTFDDLEKQICEQEAKVRAETERLLQLHRSRNPKKVDTQFNFNTAEGPKDLASFFGDKSELILIHNMGKSCPYCTLWADGLNGFAPYLSLRSAFLLVNNDPIDELLKLKNQREWKFPVASAAGTPFFKQMGFAGETANDWAPGVSIFTKDAEGNVFQTSNAGFGPGDIFCSLWQFLGMLPSWQGEQKDWGPKFELLPR